MRPSSTVSVVVPTFNRAALLPRALASVRAQTRPADEVLVVDDGSTDGTAVLLRERFPELGYLAQHNGGAAAARNAGIAATGGRWVAFLDSDDQWLPQKLERQLAAIEASPGLRLCHTNEIWIRRGRRVNPMRKHAKAGGDIFLHCLPLCVISPSSALVRRDLLEEIGGFDESLPACEDYDLWLRICAREKVLYLEEPLLLKYGGHEDQLSRRHWGLDRFRIRALEKLIGSGGLTESQRRAAARTLVGKARIVAAGARKRGKLDQAAAYERKAESYAASWSFASSPTSRGCKSTSSLPAGPARGGRE
jgi:glycosyltransferase involved in cell wall biosynthesis